MNNKKKWGKKKYNKMVNLDPSILINYVKCKWIKHFI